MPRGVHGIGMGFWTVEATFLLTVEATAAIVISRHAVETTGMPRGIHGIIVNNNNTYSYYCDLILSRGSHGFMIVRYHYYLDWRRHCVF